MFLAAILITLKKIDDVSWHALYSLKFPLKFPPACARGI